MAYKIQDIEGIGPQYGAKLAAANIKTTDDLLKLCCDAKGRKAIEAASGVGASLLLKWANKADLMRISGIGSEYSDLLEAAGVDTVKELKTRRADNLTAKMQEVNTAKKLTRNPPAESIVLKWIEAAKTLPPTITH
jgi:predicted flap endonuclease-1-like 5' DNA nuclease